MPILATMPTLGRRYGRGQVDRINSTHVPAHAVDARRGPDDPRRPEAGRVGQYPVAPPADAVVINPKKAANALAWAVKEMERCYDLLYEVGVRVDHRLQCRFRRGEPPRPAVGAGGDGAEPGSDRVFERLPFVVVVVDELNDLMMVAARDVEGTEGLCASPRWRVLLASTW